MDRVVKYFYNPFAKLNRNNKYVYKVVNVVDFW